MQPNPDRHIIAIVGMAGSGKSVLAAHFKEKGVPVVRFGGIIIRELERRGLPLNPQNERLVREDIRAQLGMDACAQLALPLIREHLQEHPLVVIDGMYSFSEYKTLKKEFGDQLVVVAVFTPKAQRYRRLMSRRERPLTLQEAVERDYTEIERIEKGGPIALADFTLVNEGSEADLYAKVEHLLGFLHEGDATL